MDFTFFQDIRPFRIILGSQSPRRKQLLELLGLDFEVQVGATDEKIPEGLQGEEAAGFLARKKWDAFSDLTDHVRHLVITADTIVCIDGKIFGKPADEKEAMEMLKKLSGRMHVVHTGVCLGNNFCLEQLVVSTQVWFRPLSNDEIHFYLEKYQPYDKAGAYGVQDWIGITAIEKISGSFYNVMGLPVMEVYMALRRFISGIRL
jgi:septum formation protein